MPQPTEQKASSDRRTANRSSLYLAASLYCDGSVYPVKIRNISSAGALLDTLTVLAPGSLVQLIRGPLIVHALVAWTDQGRLGLKFSGTVDVQRWRQTISNAEQQRVDDVVTLVKAGAVPLQVYSSASSLEEMNGPSSDLLRASKLLSRLGDRLANDAIVVANFPGELQNLDIAIQVIDAIAALMESRTDLAIDATKFASLRKSADQALNRAA